MFIAGCFVFLFVFIFAYVRHYDRRGIFFPEKEVFATPADADLAFEDSFFTTGDGLRLHGWFIPHSQAVYTFLFLHGNAGNVSHRLEIIRILHELNLNVFIVDYRGYGKSEGVPSEQGLYQDVRAAYDHLLNVRTISADTIVIYGRSLGGNVGVDLASKVRAAALISDSGFSSARDMAGVIFPLVPAHWFIRSKFDALSKIKKITCPKLIIHSRDDEMIPLRLGRKLFNNAPEPKTFLELTGSHNDSLFSDRQGYSAALERFLEGL
ncbi:alpha/beta hydrolase [Candidatus Omnitrophota bacterium]